jgi:hypothetical protein
LAQGGTILTHPSMGVFRMFASLRIMAMSMTAATLFLAIPVEGGQAQTVGHDNVGPHIFATRSYELQTGRVPDLGTTGEMEYFGGTVFSQVEVVSVMWGSDVNKTTVAEIPDFTAAIVNSTFTDQLGEYSTKGKKTVNHHKSSKQTISRGTFFGQVQITPKNQSLTLTDKDIQKELAYQISTGALPKQGPNMFYMVYFPTDITITLGGSKSCVAFGAYHYSNSKKQGASDIYYAVEPDCNAGFASITYAASHEFAEGTTDNIPTPGSNPKFPQAWNTSDGYEIADLCEGDGGTLTDSTRSYQVTQYYLNSTGACSTGNYTSP